MEFKTQVAKRLRIESTAVCHQGAGRSNQLLAATWQRCPCQSGAATRHCHVALKPNNFRCHVLASKNFGCSKVPDATWASLCFAPQTQTPRKEKDLISLTNLAYPYSRIVSRTWRADPFLNSVAQTILTSKTSIMNLVKNSDVFRHRFARNCKALETNPTSAASITDIASAKHRYDSHQKPFGRGCIYWQALVVTAQQIWDERGSGDAAGARALSFLEFITEEVMLTFSMMADAGDETLALVRFLECETFDKSRLAPELDTFMHRVKTLFWNKQCVNCGYTQHMLSTVLKQPMTVFLKNGAPKSLGRPSGPPAALIDQCLQRLSNWTTLALGTLRGEFPNFEVLQTFNMFCLANKPLRNMPPEELQALQSQRAEHVRSLASCLQLDAAALQAQLEDHLPLAQKIVLSKPMDALQAWREALHLTQRGKAATTHPCLELKQALMRFAAWGGSTGGVERLFSMGKNAAGNSKRDANFALYADELQLMCDRSERMVPLLCEEARKVWIQFYGKARAANRPIRIDSGRAKRRLSLDGKPSLEGWIKRRRAEVASLADNFPKVPLKDEAPAAPVVGDNGWTESHQRELDFQARKRASRFVEAVLEGTIPGDDVDEDMLTLIGQYMKLEDKRARDYRNKHMKKVRALLRPPGAPILGGKKIYVEKVNVGTIGAWRCLLARARATQVHDRLVADIYVVADPANPGQRVKWCTFLAGRSVCTLDYIQSAGERGTALTYQQAVNSRRHVWISQNFKNNHAELYAILVCMMKVPGSQWRLMESRSAFVDLARRRSAQRHGGEAVAFITSSERDHEALLTKKEQNTNPQTTTGEQSQSKWRLRRPRTTPKQGWIAATEPSPRNGISKRMLLQCSDSHTCTICILRQDFNGIKRKFTAMEAVAFFARVSRDGSMMGACAR